MFMDTVLIIFNDSLFNAYINLEANDQGSQHLCEMSHSAELKYHHEGKDQYHWHTWHKYSFLLPKEDR